MPFTRYSKTPAHTACEMAEFLARETPDFIPPKLLIVTRQFFISELDEVHRWST